jgi:hypothetical protein
MSFSQDLKSWLDVLHSFAYNIPPKCVAILFIEYPCLRNRLGDLHSELVSAYPVLRLELSDDSIAFVQHMLDPPCKCWLACEASLHRILSELDRIEVLDVLECDPVRASILPLDEDFPSLCRFSSPLVSITSSKESVLLFDFLSVGFVVNYLIEEDMPVALFVNLCKHILSDCICCKCGLVPILVLNLLQS